jgi:hypothetical protein
MTATLRLPENPETAIAAWLILSASIAWLFLAMTMGAGNSDQSICGGHQAMHEHCGRCYVLAATALAFTLSALGKVAGLAKSHNQGE